MPRGDYRLGLAVNGSEGQGTGLPVLGVQVGQGIRILDIDRERLRRLDATWPGWRDEYAWAPTTTGVHVYLEEWERGGSTTPAELQPYHDKSYQARAYIRGWFHERVRPARIRIPRGISSDWRARLEEHAGAMRRALVELGRHLPGGAPDPDDVDSDDGDGVE